MSTSISGLTASLLLPSPKGKAASDAHAAQAHAATAAPANAAPAHTGGATAPAKEAPAKPAPAKPEAPPERPGAAVTLVTQAQLHAVMTHLAMAKLVQYIGPLNAAMSEFQINDRLRICAFLGQIALESGELAWFHEFASGMEYDITKNPRLAKGLGNLTPGDGPRYKGRGPIQLTGRNNYIACGKALGIDLVDNPDLAVQPGVAFRTAGWFWATHGLNALADQSDYRAITHRINGGYNGYAQRVMYYNRALTVFPAAAAHA
jgi:putative chitinase